MNRLGGSFLVRYRIKHSIMARGIDESFKCICRPWYCTSSDAACVEKKQVLDAYLLCRIRDWFLCRYRGNCCQYPQKAGYLVTPAIMSNLTLKKQFWSRYWQRQKFNLTIKYQYMLKFVDIRMSRSISTFKGKTLDMFIHGFFQFRYQLSRIFFSCRYQEKQKKNNFYRWHL